MAKETTFEHPPRGHVSLLAYDPVNDRFQVVVIDSNGYLLVDNPGLTDIESRLYAWDGAAWQRLKVTSSANPNLLVELRKDGLAPQVGDLAGDDVGIGTTVLFVAGMLYGFDGSAWDRLRAESGQLSVNQYQYDGAAWRRSNLLWGYKDRIMSSFQNLNLSAGANYLYGDTVPAGEVWVITVVNGRYVSTTGSGFGVLMTDGTEQVNIILPTAPVSGRWEIQHGSWTMKAGDRLYAQLLAATTGDDLFLRYSGYKMGVAM